MATLTFIEKVNGDKDNNPKGRTLKIKSAIMVLVEKDGWYIRRVSIVGTEVIVCGEDYPLVKLNESELLYLLKRTTTHHHVFSVSTNLFNRISIYANKAERGE